MLLGDKIKVTAQSSRVYPPPPPNRSIILNPSDAHTTVNYSYNDPEWGDLLTSYNNQTITYDEIGNPLTLNGYTLEWDGRCLTVRTMNAGQFGSTYGQ